MHRRDLSGLVGGGHTGQRHGRWRVLWYLIALITMVGGLLVSGCGDDDVVQAPNATAADLSNRAFVFPSGEVFGIDPGAGEVVLVFGTFTGNRGPFRLEANAISASATGEATVSSILLQVNISNFRTYQGPPAGAQITLDPATIESDGQLRVENRALGRTATSQSLGVAANPPGGIGRLATPSRSTSIALTANDRLAVVANRETNTVTILEVRNLQGQDGDWRWAGATLCGSEPGRPGNLLLQHGVGDGLGDPDPGG
jgi:hypothetical protein